MRSSGPSTRSRASSARIRSRSGALNFIREFPATIATGLDDRLGRLRRVPRRGARAVRLRRRCAPSSGPGGQRAIRSGSASGSRRTSRCAGSRRRRILGAIRYSAGGWDSGDDPLPADRHGAGADRHRRRTGQGHETSWSQIVADRLGYEVDEVEVLHGDTSVVPLGMDTYGSRSLAVGGVALYYAADKHRSRRRRRSPRTSHGGRRGAGRPRSRRVHRARRRR